MKLVWVSIRLDDMGESVSQDNRFRVFPRKHAKPDVGTLGQSSSSPPSFCVKNVKVTIIRRCRSPHYNTEIIEANTQFSPSTINLNPSLLSLFSNKQHLSWWWGTEGNPVFHIS